MGVPVLVLPEGMSLEVVDGLLPDPHQERRSPEYCWRSWPPRHTSECGCLVREDVTTIRRDVP